MQNDPQDESPIKKALRTWRAWREIKKTNRTSWAMQNDPQDESPIKKALRTWRAWREIKRSDYSREIAQINPISCNILEFSH